MRIFRREWIFPVLVLAFVSASADASRDALSAQAAEEMHCNSVSLVQSAPSEWVAVGCGKDWTYDCDENGDCTSNGTNLSLAKSDPDDKGDDEAAEAVASALTDLACACASAGLSSHGSHHASSHHHKKK